MVFAKEKADFLSKKDKSRKGSIDAKIKNLVEKINSSDNYFTTSSCAGRILILTQPKSNKKNEVQYLFVSHEKTNFNTLENSDCIHSSLQRGESNRNFRRAQKHAPCFSTGSVFDKIKKLLSAKKLPKEDVWFRVESAILHIACKDTESALKLLKIARDAGFRRSGIISLGKNRATIELVSTEKIDTIIAKKGKLIVDSDYFKILIAEGNNKLEKAWGKIDNLNKHLHL